MEKLTLLHKKETEMNNIILKISLAFFSVTVNNNHNAIHRRVKLQYGYFLFITRNVNMHLRLPIHLKVNTHPYLYLILKLCQTNIITGAFTYEFGVRHQYPREVGS